jgi:uncharacterized protein YegL
VTALLAVNAGNAHPSCGVSNEAALRAAEEMFAGSEGRRKVLILIHPGAEPEPGNCPWSTVSIATRGDALKAAGVTIVAVNGASIAASSEVMSGLIVPNRGQGIGRQALRYGLQRVWPDVLVRSGTLTDELPANIDYVPGSAQPPAAYDAASRTLTWQLTDLARAATHRFAFRIRPREEGLWPTNVEASAALTDGWGNGHRVEYPVPEIRVYGELPPTPTFTPTPPGPTPTRGPTKIPVPIYLPVLPNTEPCTPETRHADIALVIDTSGSMSGSTTPGGPTKLEAAKSAARSFLEQLSAARDQAALVQFNTEATLLVPLGPDPAAAIAGLDQLVQASGTRIDLALDMASQELRGPRSRVEADGVIVLLTDGEPTGTTPDEVRAAGARAASAGLLVFTIGLGPDVDHQLMTDVASRDDWYFYAPDSSDLSAIYARIAVSIPCKPDWP